MQWSDDDIKYHLLRVRSQIQRLSDRVLSSCYGGGTSKWSVDRSDCVMGLLVVVVVIENNDRNDSIAR